MALTKEPRNLIVDRYFNEKVRLLQKLVCRAVYYYKQCYRASGRLLNAFEDGAARTLVWWWTIIKAALRENP